MDYVADYRKQIAAARDEYELDVIAEDAANNDYITNDEYCFIVGEAIDRTKELYTE